MKKKKDKKVDLTAYLGNVSEVRTALSVIIALAGTWALPQMLSVDDVFLEYTNSIVTVFVFLGLFGLFYKILGAGFREGYGWFWPGCMGTVFSLCMVFGAKLGRKESVPFKDGRMWICILILAVIFTLAIRWCWDMMAERKKDRAAKVMKSSEGMDSRQDCKIGFRSLCFRAGVIFVCYLPVFFAVYPGFFVYDAQDEYMQVLTRNFTTHHPLLHVLLLGGSIQLIYKLSGSINLGIACYTILQMTIVSVVFAWCVEKLKLRGMGKTGQVLLTLYFGLCPVLVMFALCSAKDGLFTCALLIIVILLQELCRKPEAFFRDRGKVILFAAAVLGMILLRHNGFYAFLVFVPVLAVYLRRNLKKVLCYLAGILIIYLFCNAALTGLLHADDSENQEMLTVPICQMARVYMDEKDMLPVEEKEILYRYLPEEALAHYTPKVSDGVKIHFNNEAFSADKADFLGLWAKWGMRHPFTYLNAWFMTSYGFWYPDTVIFLPLSGSARDVSVQTASHPKNFPTD